MFLTKSELSVILFIALVGGTSGKSYSNVYFNQNVGQSQPYRNVAQPYRYVTYGAPASAYGTAQLAALNTAPAGSVIPLPQGASFVAPCLPSQPVAPVASAGLVAYKAPVAPVVVAADPPSTYEYSYAVYDDNTGDQKQQKELSDGAVVRGQYSFLQPDGYVRQVQYVADDVSGFNALVKFLPVVDKPVETKDLKPCNDAKPEALKVEPAPIVVETPVVPVPDVVVPQATEAPAKEASETPASVIPAPAEPAPETPAPIKPTIEEKSIEVVETPAPETKMVEAEVVDALKSIEVQAVVKEDKPVETVVNVAAPIQPVFSPATYVPKFNGYISYDQLLKCIQKIQSPDALPNSPLTYVLLPTKPC